MQFLRTLSLGLLGSLAIMSMANESSAQPVQNPRTQLNPRHLPKAETLEERALNPQAALQPAGTGKTNAWQLPTDAVIPGEYEESQSVLMSWVYPDTTGGFGQWDWNLAKAYCKFYNSIQQVVPVWITVDDLAADTPEIHGYMALHGLQLTNYRFYEYQGNAFWTRDYGPIGVYHNNYQNMDFVDLHYYTGRGKDDVIPQTLGADLGKKVFTTDLRMEGGNFMSDGYGRVFHSTRVHTANQSINGWSPAATLDTARGIFNVDSLTVPDQLQCDGGTGHIDMYMKLMDEETFVVSEYDPVVTASDRQRIEDNVALLQTLKSTYDRPFVVKRIQQPRNDDGSKQQTCNDIDGDARGYVNGLLINNTFIYPTYNDGVTGDIAHDALAEAWYKKEFPGVKMVPIDARDFTPMGGALHCITMQIPTEDPLRIWHPSLTGSIAKRSGYFLHAKVEGKSATQSVMCNYRKKGTTTWMSIPMWNSTQDWQVNIPGSAAMMGDTIEYYLVATNVNGKTAMKPMSGADGPYQFQIQYGLGTQPEPRVNDHLFGAYPNPAQDYATVQYYLNAPGQTQVTLTDLAGRQLLAGSVLNETEGKHTVVIPTASLAPGVYLYSLKIDGSVSATRQLVISR